MMRSKMPPVPFPARKAKNGKRKERGHCKQCDAFMLNGCCLLCGNTEKERLTKSVAKLAVMAGACLFLYMLLFFNLKGRLLADRLGYNIPYAFFLDEKSEMNWFPPFNMYITPKNTIGDGEFPEFRQAGLSYRIVDRTLDFEGTQKVRYIGYLDGKLAYPASEGDPACYQLHFIQLQGDIPNLYNINLKLQGEVMSVAAPTMDLRGESAAENYQLLVGQGPIWVRCQSYVTFSSEKAICVAVKAERYYGQNCRTMAVTSLIFNLETGREYQIDDLFTMDRYRALNLWNDLEYYSMETEMREALGKDGFVEQFCTQKGRIGAFPIVFPDQVCLCFNYLYEVPEEGMEYRGNVYQYYPYSMFDRWPEELKGERNKSSGTV